MRYTSESTMDDRALRDVERWKDKIEVRLDNRQVFFLFFGSALVACLLFILGVSVGKRLESRGRVLPAEIEDPLALLDKVAATPRTAPEPAPVLPKVLFGGAVTPAKAPSVASKSAPVSPVPKTATSAVKAPAPGSTVAAKPTPTPVVAKPAMPALAKNDATASKPPSAGAPPKKVAVATPVAGTDPVKGKVRFTLQLGSFPDRAEAEAFSQRFTAQGAYVVGFEIPGKGLWYRVRVGDYASAKDAIVAKTAFERQHSVIAYVVSPH